MVLPATQEPKSTISKDGRDIATVVVLVAAESGWSPIPSVELLHEGMFPIDRFGSMRVLGSVGEGKSKDTEVSRQAHRSWLW